MEDWLESQFLLGAARDSDGGDTEEESNDEGMLISYTCDGTVLMGIATNRDELLPNGNPSIGLLDELLVPISKDTYWILIMDHMLIHMVDNLQEYQAQERLGTTRLLSEALTCLGSIKDSQHPNVDWHTDDRGAHEVQMPTDLAGYIAICGQRFGIQAASIDRCEQCVTGPAVFESCKVAVNMDGSVLFDGACMCCAFRGDYAGCSFMRRVPVWALQVFVTSAPTYKFRHGVLKGGLAGDYDQLQALGEEA